MTFFKVSFVDVGLCIALILGGYMIVWERAAGCLVSGGVFGCARREALG